MGLSFRDVDWGLRYNPYLIQRLRRPPENEWSARIDQAFGGMLCLSDDAWKLSHTCFSFDYMGAAEYEFGAVPKALNLLLKCKDLTAFEMAIGAAEIKSPWWIERKLWNTRKGPDYDAAEAKMRGSGERWLYVICPKDQEAGVKRWLKAHLAGNKDARTRDSTQMCDALIPDPERAPRNVGWLELDNGWLAFSERVLWERAKKLFVDHEIPEGKIPPEEPRAPLVAGPGSLVRSTRHYKEDFLATIESETARFWTLKRVSGKPPSRIGKAALAKGYSYVLLTSKEG